MKQPTAPEPAPERHDEVGNAHDAVWAVTSCGHGAHPTWWACIICHVPANDGEPTPPG